MMRPRSSSRGRNTSASVIVAVTVSEMTCQRTGLSAKRPVTAERLCTHIFEGRLDDTRSGIRPRRRRGNDIKDRTGKTPADSSKRQKELQRTGVSFHRLRPSAIKMENDYYNNDNRSLTLRHLQTGCQETLFSSDRRAHTENRTSLPVYP